MWTCQRQAGGVKCKTVNENRKRLCVSCGKPKPKKRQVAHRKALETTYEEYVQRQGSEVCAICGRKPGRKRLDRDHCHKTGAPRSLLCSRCNRALPNWVTPDWLQRARLYLLSHEVPSG